ncbi:ribonuclease P protein subunit p30 [Parasteatoda tepidariorum]|uniref:ribonuclease P protein subunit p30 n=1 Tax=Parasteatoda tepidariorum TaxID=114398 RepID=UPI00077FBB46|nr:ribonuclease P protein subunit p30 [Parasteatoda tepidariorum]
MDLNICLEPGENYEADVKNLIQRAFDFGYECIALNTVLDSSEVTGKKINIPEPKIVDFKVKTSRNFRILTRLTAVIKDGMHVHHILNSPITKKYDILAFQPVGSNMLHKVSEFDVDIISLNLTEDFGFRLKKTFVGPLINKGKCLEITYAPCLRDQTMKRRTISNSQLLVEVTKSKNLIISSGATKPLELRSVEDVENLGLLFGLKRNEAHAAVRKNGKLVLSHAGTRSKTGCGIVSITGMINLPKHQGWIIHACKVPKPSNTSAKLTDKRQREADSKNDKSRKKNKVDS